MAQSKITPSMAAEIMGVGPQFVRIGLQQGILPFGYAYKLKTKGRESKVYTYYINPNQFREFIGEDYNGVQDLCNKLQQSETRAS